MFNLLICLKFFLLEKTAHFLWKGVFDLFGTKHFFSQVSPCRKVPSINNNITNIYTYNRHIDTLRQAEFTSNTCQPLTRSLLLLTNRRNFEFLCKFSMVGNPEPRQTQKKQELVRKVYFQNRR
jgi:hypothetical protein